MVRRPQGPARRVLGDPFENDSKRVSQLLYAGSPRCVGGIPHVRTMTTTIRLSSLSRHTPRFTCPASSVWSTQLAQIDKLKFVGHQVELPR